MPAYLRCALLLLAAASTACARRPDPPGAALAAPRHLVLVTIDTLRADRLGCYGSATVATPHMDRLCLEGAMAPRAAVHVPLTRPSHASLFTGLLPTQHGIRDNVSPALPSALPTMAELLAAAGFRTAAFISSVVLSSESGLARGFEVYGEEFSAGHSRFLGDVQKRGDLTMEEALSWLRRRPQGRLFLWVHLYDPHDPYEPPEPYASQYGGRPYDGEVAFSDELVGRLDAALAETGLRDQTLLVVTSDHGEGLGDHGEAGHGFFVYESTLAVPLVLRGPGVRAGVRLDVTVRTVDLLPTVLELLGVPLPPGRPLAGRSLATALRGGDQRLPEAPVYAESLLPLLHYGWSDLRSLREGRWKYVQAPRPELYDLEVDPGERSDLAGSQPARRDALAAALARMLAAENEAAPQAGAGVSAELREKLGALGYLGPGAAAAGAAGGGADPKDKLEEFRLLERLVREGLQALRAGDPGTARARFARLLERGIRSFEVHYYLGRALLGLGRHAEAASHFRAAIGLRPADGAAHRDLAESQAATGDLAGALESLRRARSLAPKDPAVLDVEARVWLRRGRRSEAIRAYREALPLAPGEPTLRMRLGQLLRDQGDLAAAAGMMREALGLDPRQPAWWAALGGVLAPLGQLAEAEGAFARAEQLDPADATHAHNRGLMLMRQGRYAEAEPHFRRALERQPGLEPARRALAEIASRR